MFVPVDLGEDVLYKFNLGPASNLGYNRKTDRYCKKYRFFYSAAFKALTIHGKRLLLMGAFRMSVLKSEEVLFDYHEIVPDSRSPFTRQRLLDAVAAIHDALGHIVKISFASRAFSKKEVLVFTFTEGVLDEYKENRAERTLLRRTIFNWATLGISMILYAGNWNGSANIFSVHFCKIATEHSYDIQKELQKLTVSSILYSLKNLARLYLPISSCFLPQNKPLLI